MRARRSNASASASLQRELLNPPSGRRLADVEIALRVDAHAVRSGELSHLAAAAAELADHLEIRSSEDPHLVVGAVSEIEPLLLRVRRQNDNEGGAGGERRGRDDLFGQELSLMIENLDAIAAAIGHVDLAVLR